MGGKKRNTVTSWEATGQVRDDGGDTKDSRYTLGDGFGDRLDIRKEESGVVFRFLICVLRG